MPFDVLVLNSGEWRLAAELPAQPWHVLIYHQVGEHRNELHLWLPRQACARVGEYAFRRYWVEGGIRWCVELPPDPDAPRSLCAAVPDGVRIRFTALDGRVLWSLHRGSRRLADFTDTELAHLRRTATLGLYSRI